MEYSTFTLRSDIEANALVQFFTECHISASRKGKVVKAYGHPELIACLFEKFLKIVLI